MRAAADIIFVVEQAVNPGDAPHQRQKFAVAHQAIEPVVRGTQPCDVADNGFPGQLALLIARVSRFEGRELRDQLPAKLRIEKRLDHHVSKRLRRAELAGKVLGAPADFGMDQGKHLTILPTAPLAPP